MNEPRTIEHQPKARASILYAFAAIAWAIVMTGLHWLLTGISVDFGTGVAVGMFLMFGLIGVVSKTVRELP